MKELNFRIFFYKEGISAKIRDFMAYCNMFIKIVALYFRLFSTCNVDWAGIISDFQVRKYEFQLCEYNDDICMVFVL